MLGFEGLGKLLLCCGIILVLFGLLIMVGGKYISLGNLPGDFILRKDNFTLYFPLTSAVLISLILTIILNVLTRK